MITVRREHEARKRRRISDSDNDYQPTTYSDDNDMGKF